MIINQLNVKFIFNKISEEEKFIFLAIKVQPMNSNKTLFFLQYQYINLRMSNFLCELAGYEKFYSVYHLNILKFNVRIIKQYGIKPSNSFLYS